MKKIIASVVAGLTLGVTGTAVAGQHYYWSERGTSYQCEGIPSGVVCKSGNFQIGVTRSFVYVQHRATEQMFGCRKRANFSACISN